MDTIKWSTLEKSFVSKIKGNLAYKKSESHQSDLYSCRRINLRPPSDITLSTPVKVKVVVEIFSRKGRK